MDKLDFAKGYKTIAGVVLLLSPYIKSELGLEISADDMDSLFSHITNVVGATLFVYGLIMKLRRKWLETKQKSQ